MQAAQDELSDDELMRLFRDGEAPAFEVLFARYHAHVYNFACYLLGNAEGAEELMQEAFLAVVRGAPNYTPRGSFRSWLMSIVRNRCLNRLEAERARREVPAGGDMAALEASAGSPFRAATARIGGADRPAGTACSRARLGSSAERGTDERLALVQDELRKLPPRQREALLLYAVEDLDYREISEVLAMPMNTIKTLIHRARATLAAAVAHKEGGL